MPLRDHFRPPVSSRHSWDELHGMWPATIVQRLYPLPPGYTAAPKVHLGKAFETDISAYEQDDAPSGGTGGGGTAVWAAPAPTLTLETEVAEQDEYEVRIYDERYGRRLVAAIEIVSPANKDRPEHRQAFAVKAAALVQQGVAVTIVDVVTVRQFNLYADVLDLQGHTDPAMEAESTHLYAATMRIRTPLRGRPKLDTWFTPLVIGQPLPVVPLWLADDLAVRLDLEPTYEDACRVLSIA